MLPLRFAMDFALHENVVRHSSLTQDSARAGPGVGRVCHRPRPKIYIGPTPYSTLVLVLVYLVMYVGSYGVWLNQDIKCSNVEN